MRITFTTGPVRKKPKAGDTKLIKGVMHKRELRYVRDFQGNRIGLDFCGGRHHFDWVPA